MSPLEVEGLTVVLGGARRLRNLSFRLERGEVLGLIGPNGAGKSTALKAIAQLVTYRGQVRLGGAPIRTLAARERARRLAYLGPDDTVQCPISARDLVALGRHPHRGSWWRGAEQPGGVDWATIELAMRRTDVWDLRERPVTQLSGGERARVRLARVLAVGAPLVLADEPVAALDPRHQIQVMRLLRWAARSGGGTLVVLHGLTLASRFCDRLLLLDRGEPVALGPPREVLTAETLRRIYGVSAIIGEHAGECYAIPWDETSPSVETNAAEGPATASRHQGATATVAPLPSAPT